MMWTARDSSMSDNNNLKKLMQRIPPKFGAWLVGAGLAVVIVAIINVIKAMMHQ